MPLFRGEMRLARTPGLAAANLGRVRPESLATRFAMHRKGWATGVVVLTILLSSCVPGPKRRNSNIGNGNFGNDDVGIDDRGRDRRG